MELIRTGIIGAGFVGALQLEALRRVRGVEVIALAGSAPALTRQKAAELGIPRPYDHVEQLIADPDVDVVHNCTPNHLHLEVNCRILQAGKHVFSEKPLARNAAESRRMIAALEGYGGVHGVNFNYRMYPLVRHMREQIRAGALGKINLVHGHYLQDWLLYDTDYNWRVEVEAGGKARAIGDLGSHWCDLAQSLTGLRITEVMADFSTVIPVRKKSSSAQTFARAAAGAYEQLEVKTEDWAAVLIRFDNGAHGMFAVSEVCAGRKCLLELEINGSQASFHWNQEQGDRMWVGHREGGNQIVIRDPNQLDPHSRRYTLSPAGHPEGWHDALKGNIQSFYDFIREGKRIGRDATDFATFYDGHDIMLIVDAIVESHERQAWVKVRRETDAG